ncbi:hypothetical protein [Histidinibacterium aquaticum]|nr:hypothetical protein [Histidinibacterium aquaticum]
MDQQTGRLGRNVSQKDDLDTDAVAAEVARLHEGFAAKETRAGD